ncbi:MAG TPA: 2-dehydropantoate 2-reductase [Roseiflexaceae bacterium]|nr:2-dehydropantoate 2-reductase [Roseiflexaceae bacterium]
MTIVVVGAGAIGLLVAGRLAQTGRPTALLARPAGAAELARSGIRITQAGQTEQITSVAALGAPEELPAAARPVELAILCVKGYDTAGAIPALAALDPQQVLTLQNGIGNEELLLKRFEGERVISGAITTSVEVAGPGQIVVTKAGGIGLAPVRPGEALSNASDPLSAAGFPMSHYADYRAMKWSKALLNMLGNATAALLDMPVQAVYADAGLFALERETLREALRVMERLKIAPIDLPRYRAATLAQAVRWVPAPILRPLLRRMIAGGRGGKPPSLQLELARGNPRSEGEFLYGAIARAAAGAGLDAPVNRRLWEILSAVARRETPWETYRGRPEKLIEDVTRHA